MKQVILINVAWDKVIAVPFDKDAAKIVELICDPENLFEVSYWAKADGGKGSDVMHPCPRGISAKIIPEKEFLAQVCDGQDFDRWRIEKAAEAAEKAAAAEKAKEEEEQEEAQRDAAE